MLSVVPKEISKRIFNVPDPDPASTSGAQPKPTSTVLTSKTRKPRTRRGRGRGRGRGQGRGRGRGRGGRLEAGNERQERVVESEDEEERVVESEDEDEEVLSGVVVGEDTEQVTGPAADKDGLVQPSTPQTSIVAMNVDSDREDGDHPAPQYVSMDFPSPLVPPPLELVPPLIPLPLCSPERCQTDSMDHISECSLCKRNWHISCVREHASTEPGYEFDGDCDDWCCWECIDGSDTSQWDHLLLGQFILVNADPYTSSPTGRPIWYPAEIVTRLGTQVQMQWHRGNLYDDSSRRPTSPFFTLHPLECVRLYQRAGEDEFSLLNSTSNGLVGMPWILYPGAVDELGFRDEGLINALHRATPAILDVLRGRRGSRVVALFEHWFNESKTRSSQDQAAAAAFFSMAFTFPIFPAHFDCLHPFLGYIETIARNTTTFNSSHCTIVSHIASVLYQVVVTRYHLGVDAHHDEAILMLAFNGPLPTFDHPLTPFEVAAAEGRLTRTPTTHEQAYASSIPGVVDTHVLSSLASVGLLRRIPQETLCDVTTTTSPIRAVGRDGTTLEFSSSVIPGRDTGLVSSEDTALPPIPREFRAVIALPSGARPLPRPRPVRCSAAQRGLPQPVRLPPSEIPSLEGSPLLDIVPPQRALRERTQLKSRDPPSPPSASIPAKKRKGSKSWYAYVDVYGNILPSSSDTEDAV